VRPLDHAAHILRRSGVYVSRNEKSVWVCGRTIADFDEAAQFMNVVRSSLTPNHFLLSSPRADTSQELRKRYPGSNVVPLPWNSDILVRQFFRSLDPVILIWLGFDECVPLKVVQYSHSLGIPIIVAEGRASASEKFMRKAAPLVDHFYVQDDQVASMLRSSGGKSFTVTCALQSEYQTTDSSLPGLKPVHHLLARVPRRSKGSTRPFGLMSRFMRTSLAGWIASNRSNRRIESWDELHLRLDCPESILCLGNGPSSEDPAVLDVKYDCLMRVNHRWINRGVLVEPDMVFVGSISTTLKVPPCVFGFKNIARETTILVRHLLIGLRLNQLEHFTLERVPSNVIKPYGRSAYPTNGAIMIATAAALKPEKIVIAGIDLFNDPRGRYPGDVIAENEYLAGHDRDLDIAVIAHALANFDGELVILSPGLDQALKERHALNEETGLTENPSS
jgi:hypothetical protein